MTQTSFIDVLNHILSIRANPEAALINIAASANASLHDMTSNVPGCVIPSFEMVS
jgi:hypothetical protein